MSEEIDNLNPKFHKESIEWRRSKVLELSSKGFTQIDIARILQVSQATISLDLQYLKCQAAQHIREYIDETIPFEFNKAITGFNIVIRDSFVISSSSSTTDVRDKLSALSLVMEAYNKKIELLTNSTIINKAAEGVSNMKKELEDIQMNKRIAA